MFLLDRAAADAKYPDGHSSSCQSRALQTGLRLHSTYSFIMRRVLKRGARVLMDSFTMRIQPWSTPCRSRM